MDGRFVKPPMKGVAMIITHFILVLALGLLICNWWVGEQTTQTKLFVTLFYVTSWFLLLVDLWPVIAVQALFSIVVGMMTFGIDWMMRR